MAYKAVDSYKEQYLHPFWTVNGEGGKTENDRGDMDFVTAAPD